MDDDGQARLQGEGAIQRGRCKIYNRKQNSVSSWIQQSIQLACPGGSVWTFQLCLTVGDAISWCRTPVGKICLLRQPSIGSNQQGQQDGCPGRCHYCSYLSGNAGQSPVYSRTSHKTFAGEQQVILILQKAFAGASSLVLTVQHADDSFHVLQLGSADGYARVIVSPGHVFECVGVFMGCFRPVQTFLIS